MTIDLGKVKVGDRVAFDTELFLTVESVSDTGAVSGKIGTRDFIVAGTLLTKHQAVALDAEPGNRVWCHWMGDDAPLIVDHLVSGNHAWCSRETPIEGETNDGAFQLSDLRYYPPDKEAA